MVNGDHEDVALVLHPQQANADDRTLIDVDAAQRFFGRQTVHFRLALFSGKKPEIAYIDAQRGLGGD